MVMRLCYQVGLIHTRIICHVYLKIQVDAFIQNYWKLNYLLQKQLTKVLELFGDKCLEEELVYQVTILQFLKLTMLLLKKVSTVPIYIKFLKMITGCITKSIIMVQWFMLKLKFVVLLYVKCGNMQEYLEI